MKKFSLLLTFLIFGTLFTLASCGGDLSLGSKSNTSSQSSLTGKECGCTASYMPVCGVNNITYDNICIANCYGVSQTVQGNCICSSRPVCGSDGNTYTECDAQSAIRKGYINSIVKFADCRSGSY
ncbi:MAG: hypothetical protein HOP07_09620 [Bacteriovoracaceae bacterium]|nr:hypothetical protein [Bacteriovoracaceae bacterium]